MTTTCLCDISIGGRTEVVSGRPALAIVGWRRGSARRLGLPVSARLRVVAPGTAGWAAPDRATPPPSTPWPVEMRFSCSPRPRRTRSPRVVCGARRPVSHLQDAEVAQADFVPLDELPGDESHEIVQHGFGRLFRRVTSFRQFGGDLLQREGGLRHGLRRHRRLGRCGGLLRGRGNLLAPLEFGQQRPAHNPRSVR